MQHGNLPPITADDIDIWIRTGIGEARSERHLGKCAVMWVVLNRFRKQSWWGKTIKDVCLFPWQFSCWNENDPNRKLIDEDRIKESPSYATFKSIVDGILIGNVPDLTLGSCHFHTRHIQTPKAWYIDGKKPEPIGLIDNHFFFKDIP